MVRIFRYFERSVSIECVKLTEKHIFFSLSIELEAATEELEQEESGGSNAEEGSENNEEMASENESVEGDNEFDDNDSEGGDQVDDDEGNAGWADAFAKVLQQKKPKNKKYLVLSKAKKLADKSEKDDKKVTFEIDGKGDNDDDDEEEDDVKPEIDDSKPTDNELELALIARKERSNKLLQLRVKPGAMDRERERAFKRISTKGVVQLFNAVRAQQRDLVDRLEKAGPLDHRRDEVLNNVNKRQFLDMLMGGKRAKSENVDNPVKDEIETTEDSTKPSQWSVLRDDFMTNKKLKHWDEDEGSDDQAGNNNDMDSDSD